MTVIPNSTVMEIADDGEVTLMDNQFQKQTLQVDNVVLASVVPDGSLHQQLIDDRKHGDVDRRCRTRCATCMRQSPTEPTPASPWTKV